MGRRLAVITGASTGIGRASAQQLAARGWDVIAGVRSPDRADLEPAIEVTRLDITDADDIAGLAQRVGDGAAYDALAIVNNAGISLSAPVELTPMEVWRQQLETNLIGHVAVMQALLPALAEARDGRVVNVSTAATLLTSPMTGAYAAAKAGLEKASDALRRELGATRVKVVVVQPGAVRTDGWSKAMGATQDESTSARSARYAALASAVDRQAQRFAAGGTDVERAAGVVVRAVEARRPRPYYRIGGDAKLITAMSRLLPARIQDRVVARIVDANY